MIIVTMQINPRRHKVKKVTRRHKEGGQSHPSPLLLTLFIRLTRYLTQYFQLIETTCCLIGFQGNHSNIMRSLATATLDFQIFNFFSNSNLNTENSEKTTFSDWNLQNRKIHCKIISI